MANPFENPNWIEKEPRERTCPVCQGSGKTGKETCDKCKGEGVVISR